jgi:fluoride exporter
MINRKKPEKLMLYPALSAPIAISLGAIAGALSRYYLTLWFTQQFGADFPYGTFVINLSGCFFMGLITTLAIGTNWITPEFRLMLTTGFLGAYTTFSTYGLDTLNLLRMQHWAIAGSYWLGSAVLGIGGVQLGTLCARAIRSLPH